MKNITCFILSSLLGFSLFAQDYESPDTGVNWTLEDVMQNSPSTVSFDNGIYTLSENLTVAENDTLSFNSALTVHIDEDIKLTVAGKFFSQGTSSDKVLITATDSLTPYEGFRFEEISEVSIDHTTIKNGGGLKVITPNFTLTNSMLAYNVSGSSTGAAVSLSHGSPLIENNVFLKNDLPAVSSGANQAVAAKILNNYLDGNGQSNQNRPQINMGPSGSDTLKIQQNTIIGDRDMDQVGGIAVSNFIGGQIIVNIDDNIITDNRYGMTVAGGNAFANIRRNSIEDNDSQGEPNLGGSGISLNTASNTQTIIASSNEFRGNLWGITLIDQASINLGDDADNPGQNVFANNGNSGEIYALYNNTPNTIQAKHNCWIEGQENTLADAESVIFHQADDSSLGEVIYDPINCSFLSAEEFAQTDLAIYPNPASDAIYLNNADNFEQLTIYSLQGQILSEKQLQPNQNEIPLDLVPGLYILTFQKGNNQVSKKLIVE